MEEQLLQIKFDWPVRLAHPMEVITPWPHMPNLIQLVQGTEHGSVISLPLPVGRRTTPQTGCHLESHVWKSHSLLDYLIQLVQGTEQVLPTAIRYMVVVLER